MKQRYYFDANSAVGRMNYIDKMIPYKVQSLSDDLEYYRIHAALVSSNTGRDYSFVKGNKELIDDIKMYTRLFGVAAVIPDIQYELSSGYEYFDYLLEKDIKAFKLYPKLFNHGFNSFSLQKLASFMIDKDLPLFLDIQEISWSELREVLGALPELKVVLCNTSWVDNRNLFPVLGSFKNIYVDISSNQANDILDVFQKHFGIDRILFGTNYPNKSMGGLKALVEYSGLSEEDKDKVAYKNILKILDINEQDLKLYDNDKCLLDEIAKKTDSGRKLENILVIDSHTHMVDKQHITTSLVPMFNADADNMIKKMDRLGIERMISSPWEGIMTSGISANETILDAQKNFGERIEGYATCNPNYEDDLKTVVDIYHKKYRFIGIKPYNPTNHYDLLGEKYKRWFMFGNENNLIMLVHSGTREIADKVSLLSDKYRNISFLMAHSGISYQVADWNIEIANKRKNVYLEITYTTLTNGLIEYLVEKVGAEKVLFGSDMPMRDPAPQLAWVCYAKISVEDKKKILGENILRLIKRCYK